MYKVTMIVGLLTHVRRRNPELAGCAMAALLFLAAAPTPARAQNTYGGTTFVHTGTIGLVPGQRVRVAVPNFYFQDGIVKFFVKHSIKVYEIRTSETGVTSRESNLVYSGESGGIYEHGLHEYGHGLDTNDALPGPDGPVTSRIQVLMVVESFLVAATQTLTEDRSVDVSPPTFELIDSDDRSVTLGLLLPAPGPTQAQLDSFSAFEGFHWGVSVGAAAGQTVRILIDAADAAGTSLNKPSVEPDVIVSSGDVPAVHVKAFNASTGALLWSRELPSPAAGPHAIDINRDDLREEDKPLIGRVELRIEVVIVGMKVSLRTFEVFDNNSGKTTVRGDIGPMKVSMETIKKAWKDASGLD